MVQDIPPYVMTQPQSIEDDLENSADGVEHVLESAAEQTRLSFDKLVDWVSQDSTDFATAMGVALGFLIGGLVLRQIVILAKSRTQDYSFLNIILGAFKRIGWFTFLVVGLLIGIEFSEAPRHLRNMLHIITTVVLIFEAAGILNSMLVDLVYRRTMRRGENTKSIQTGMAMVRAAIGFIVWSIALLLILDNINVDVTALIAGLGIGGIAIGLAAQGMFTDLFAGLAIVFDKPFRRGDFIVFGDHLGEIEEIGLKTTRVRALSGEQIIITNSNLLDETIQNFQRLHERRWLFRLGVIYQTTPEALAAIPDWIKEIIEAEERVRFERAHFADYGASSLDFEIVCHILSQDYEAFMDVRHAINLAIFKRFADEGVSFAYPTRTLMMARSDGSVFDYEAEGEPAPSASA